MTVDLIAQLVAEMSLSKVSIQAVIKLLEEGNTIPFIARYRKEATGNLDEVQIRAIQERHTYLLELEERRGVILASIESQGKLTDELKEQILACTTKNGLEDLYLPFKPKRRTRAAIAREKGLEPLAEQILAQSKIGDPMQLAASFINEEKGVATVEEALAGARDIVAEKIAENMEVRTYVRESFAKQGIVVSKALEGIQGPTKFEQYYDFKEAVKTIPSHRYLAIRRGEKEGILSFQIEIESEPVLNHIQDIMGYQAASRFGSHLLQAIEDAYKRLLLPSVETDVRIELKMASDRAAVDIFAENLRHLLLAAPLGGRSVIGIDPGIRTGCKCAAIDQTGKYLDTVTIYLSQGEKSFEQARRDLLQFIKTYRPYAIGIGNGTAGRETESFVRTLLKEAGCTDIIVVPVNEAGASVYSASDIARKEFPDLDLTIRGAISIARRLQDPLAELVKIDPKSIGVGQYQHDVHQPMLQDQLHQVVESCVNHVGVDVNTASAPLLSYVAGIGPSLANKIVKYRESHGAFRARKQLREIPGFGIKTFEQAAGFLRVREGENPLDASAVHPERYELVEQMAQDLGVSLGQLVNQHSLVERIDFKKYIQQGQVGELTLKDIMDELKKPGRDPRATFEPPCFREDVMSIQDLKPGMKLEGIVTNVTAFGAFVDIGVHQDGLVHISELTDRYIKHPAEAVSPGDKIKVEVQSVDVERKRIALTAKMGKGNFSDKKEKKPVKKEAARFESNPFASL
jgi:protein Tex